MSWLKDRWEEVTAQVKMGDNQTASTVRAARAKAAPATTRVNTNQPGWSVRKPQSAPLTTQQRVNQSYGPVGFSGFKNYLKDYVDNNTEADRIRRAATTGLNESYDQEQDRLTKQAQASNDKLGTIHQVMKSVPAGVAEFVGKTPGSIGQMQGRVAKTVNDINNPVLRTGAKALTAPFGGLMTDKQADYNIKFGQGLNSRVQNKLQQSAFGDRADDNKWVTGAGKMVGQLGGQIATGGLGTAAIGSQMAADEANKAQAAGKSNTYSTLTGLGQGGIGALSEKFGVDRFLPGNNVTGNTVTKLLKRGLTEGTQEVQQQFTQNLIANKAYNPEQGLKDGLAESFVMGGLAGGAMSPAVDIMNRPTAPKPTTSLVAPKPEPTRTRLRPEEARIWSDYQETLYKGNRMPAQVVNETHNKARQIADSLGVDIITGSPDEIAGRMNPLLEQSMAFQKEPTTGLVSRARSRLTPLNEGGYISLGAPEPKKLPQDIKDQFSKQGSFGREAMDRLEANKMSKGDLERAGVIFDPKQVKKIAQTLPEFKANPVMTYRKGDYSYTDAGYGRYPVPEKARSGVFEFKHSRGTMRLNPEALFGKEMAQKLAQTAKDGEQVDFTDTMKASGNRLFTYDQTPDKPTSTVAKPVQKQVTEKQNSVDPLESLKQEALLSYTGNDFSTINTHVKGRKLADMDKPIRDKVELLDKSMTDDIPSGTYYRGMVLSQSEIDDMIKTGKFKNDGYSSVSSEMQGAERFTQSRRPWVKNEKPVVFQLEVKNGQKGADLTKVSKESARDNEKLLPRNADYVIKNVTEVDGKYVVDAEYKATQSQPPKSPIESLKQEARKYKSELDELEKIKEQFVQKYGDTSQFSAKYADRYLKLRDELLPKAEDAIIETQGLKKVYHGTTHKWEGDFKEKDTFFTPNKKFAENVADEQVGNITEKLDTDTSPDGTSYYPTIVERYLPKDSKIFDATNKADIDLLANKLPENVKITTFIGGEANMPKSEVLDLLANDKNSWQLFEGEIKNIIRKNGYDGWKASEKGYESIGLFNPNNTLKKQQLTDLYNQATQSQPPKSTPVQKVDPLESLKQEARTTEPIFERDINTGKMKMQSSKQASKEKYSIANSDISRTKNPGMNQDGFTVEDWGGKKRFVSLDDASPETKMKVRKAEAEFERAKANSTGVVAPGTKGPVQIAREKLNDAYSDAIDDLKLQDYATTENGGRTFNSKYNDWLETKYKDRNIDSATIKDMATNPQKYRSQFEAETATQSQPPKSTPKAEAPDPLESLKQEAMAGGVKYAGKTGTLSNSSGKEIAVKIGASGELTLTKDVVDNGELIARAGDTEINGVPLTIGNQGDYFIKEGKLKLDTPTQSQPPKSTAKTVEAKPPTPFEQNLQTAGLAPKKAKGLVVSETKPLNGQKIQKVRTAPGEVEQRVVQDRSDEIADALGMPAKDRVPTTDSQRAERVDTAAQNGLENIKNNPEIVRQAAAPSTLKDKTKRKTFEEATKKYLGGTRSAEIERQATIASLNKEFKLSDKEKINAIISRDDPSVPALNEKVMRYNDRFKQLTDAAYKSYTDQGVKMGYVSSYLPRIYKNPETGQEVDLPEFKALIQGSKRMKGREAEKVAVDWLVEKDPTKLLERYYKSMDNAVAGRQYMKDLEDNGLVTASTEPVRGMRPVIAEGLQTDGKVFYAQKDVAHKLNELFGSKEATNLVEKTLEKGAGVNSLFQSFVLSGGVPNTPINAFGMMQLLKEGMALHPIKAGRAFFGGGLSKSYANKVFTAKKDIMKLMVENDLDIRVNLEQTGKWGNKRIRDAFKNEGKAAGLNQAWNEFTNDATFGRFMPMLEVLHFENVYKHQLKGGLIRKPKSSAEAARIAAESTKNFYGKTSVYKTSTRSKAVDDAAGALLFAPRFRESMVNFWVKNAKALVPTNYGKAEYRDNQKFMVASAVMYAAMTMLNEAMNGARMDENPDGKKDKLIMPASVAGKFGIDTKGKDIAVPFLPSIATVPRNLASLGANLATGKFNEAGKNAKAFASMPVKTVGDILTNEDYFGNKIVQDDSSPLQKFTQAASYVASSNMQPWIREALNVKGQKWDKETKKTWGIKEKSTFETLSNAGELPLRFYKPDTYRYGENWTPKGGKDEKFNFKQQRERAALGGEIKNISKTLKLNKRQDELFKSLSSVEFNDDGTLKEDNNPFYKSQRYTALQDDGVFEAMKQKSKLNAKLNGKPIDPIFSDDLAPDQRRVLLWKKTLPPGTSDPTVKKLYEQDWYQDYRNKESAYFEGKKAWNKKMGYKDATPNTNEYPIASKDVEDAQNAYFNLPKGGARTAFRKNNPDVWNKMIAFWDSKDAWTNGERSKLGLGAVDDEDSGGFSYGSKRSSKRGGRGSKGGSKYDYTKNLFASGSDSASTSKQLRAILEKAMSGKS